MTPASASLDLSGVGVAATAKKGSTARKRTTKRKAGA